MKKAALQKGANRKKPMQKCVTPRNGSQPGRQDTNDSSIKTPNNIQVTSRPAINLVKLNLIAKQAGNTRKTSAITQGSVLILSSLCCRLTIFYMVSANAKLTGAAERRPTEATY